MPTIAKQISERTCFHTGKGNFFVIEILDDQDIKQEYEIYFKVSKSKSQKGMLLIFIESAYIRDEAHRSSQPAKKKISFFVIAHQVSMNKAIKVPPK